MKSIVFALSMVLGTSAFADNISCMLTVNEFTARGSAAVGSPRMSLELLQYTCNASVYQRELTVFVNEPEGLNDLSVRASSLKGAVTASLQNASCTCVVE